MDLSISTIFEELNFLTPSLRLQYTNFIYRHRDRLNEYLSFDDVIYRLRMEEPIEYVFNLAEFYGFEFYVDKRCLIPRPETQDIVDKTLKFIQENKEEKEFTIIDIGTGSGCIILSIANTLKNLNLKIQNINFIAIDISPEALEVARINKEAFKLEEVNLINIDFHEFDFQLLKSPTIICSNLPYIPNKEKLQVSVANYEPRLALFGGENGDELNKGLLIKVRENKNIRAIFMEGYNGDIYTEYF